MRKISSLFQRNDEAMPEVAAAPLTAEVALQLCLEKWGPGVFVKIVALVSEKYDPREQAIAREKLTEHRKSEPHLRQDEEYDGGTPISVMLAERKEWHVVSAAWRKEERRLSTVAFPQLFIVGTNEGMSLGCGQGYERGASLGKALGDGPMTEPIKPALTAEEWERTTPGTLAYDRAIQSRAEPANQTLSDLHALAALALYGQPFGFTREDVRILRAQALFLASSSLRGQNPASLAFSALADRTEALLPPEKPPT